MENSLKVVVLRLLCAEEVVIQDDLGHFYRMTLEAIPEGVDFEGDTIYIIRSDRLKG